MSAKHDQVGSIPTRASNEYYNARLRWEVKRLPYKESDVGSSPTPGTKNYASFV